MAEPPKKAPKRVSAAQDVNELRCRLPHITQSALASLLDDAKRIPLPECVSRRSLGRAISNIVDQSTPYGPLHKPVQLTDDITIVVQDPAAMLHTVVSKSQAVQSLLQRMLANRVSLPAEPHGILLYLDEITAGNTLNARNPPQNMGNILEHR